MKPRPALLVAVGCALVIVWLNRACSSPLVAHGLADTPILSSPGGDFRFLGAGSCAAAACHGGQGGSGTGGNEYSTWAARDKHARAYQVLFEPRSLNIMRHLHPAQKAHEYSLCLNCHVHSQFAAVRSPAEFFKTDGVSCESCHGPAEKWLSEHYKPSWKRMSLQEKLELGMRDAKSLPNRIELCLACHVGSPHAEVNHDLIAAGHPRLNFEFSAFHASWARHWPDDRDKDPALGGHADFETRGWVLGQVKSAQAALRLLQARAQGERRPWLEFSEMDCYACHHDLKGKSWRQAPENGAEARRGKLPWSPWYFSQLTHAMSVSGSKNAAKMAEILEAIAQKMAAGEDQKLVAELAEKAIGLAELPPTKTAGPLELFNIIRAEDMLKNARSWDEAAQVYLALAAVHNAWMDRKNFADTARLDLPPEGFRKSLHRVQNVLRFPGGFDSPQSFDPAPVRHRLKLLRVAPM